MLFLSIEGYSVLEDNNFQLNKIKEGWERSLSILRAEIGEATFKSWFKNIQFGDFSRSKLTLLVPTRFMRDWIENHYLDRILSILSKELREVNSVVIDIASIDLKDSKASSKDQKDKYLPDLINGKKIGCFGLTESEAGSDPASMKTTFKVTKDGYILNGAKNWITNAPIADVFIIWALEENKDHKSIEGFILEKNLNGLKTSAIENKTSLRISPTGQIILNDVLVPKESRLKNTNGWKSVFSCLNKARFGISFGVLGAATECWMISKDYVEDRIMFKKSLASNQLIQKKLSGMQIEINLGLASCLLSAKALDSG